MHDADAFVSARKFIQNSSRRILRSVIHSNDFKPRIIDGCKRGYRSKQLLLFITRRKNQRNARTISIRSRSEIFNKWQMQRAVGYTQPMKNPEECRQSEQRQSRVVLDFVR